MLKPSASASSIETRTLPGIAVERLASAGVESPLFDAQVLLAAALGVDRARVLAGTVEADESGIARFEAMLARRISREPVAYILGRREFYSLEIEVNGDVLVPRPETETLVDVALEFIAGRPRARVLEVGTGPGAVAIAIATNAPHAEIVATDISEAALAVARRNASRCSAANRIDFVLADICRPLSGKEELGRFDLIISNPPYISDSEFARLAPEVRDFEPSLALRGGPDGLHFFRRIAEDAPSHLARGAMLALEVGDGQDGAVRKILEDRGLSPQAVIRDLGGKARVVTARP
jgi:release factor glutamine methyltransferase